MSKREAQLVLCLECLGVQLRALATRSTQVNILIWAALGYWAYTLQTYWPLVLHPFVILVIDAFERVVGISPFSREDSSVALYNHMRAPSALERHGACAALTGSLYPAGFITANPYGGGVDLGFNYYNGDYTK